MITWQMLNNNKIERKREKSLKVECTIRRSTVINARHEIICII